MPDRPAAPGQGGLTRRRTVTGLALGVLLAGPALVAGQPGPPARVPPAGAPGPAPDGPGPTRRVLLLYGEPRLTPAVVAVDTVIRSTVEARSPVPVAFYTEYLDTNLFDGDLAQPELRALLRRKYATRPLDLIIAAGSRPLRMALHNRSELFSGAPIVFVSVDPRAAADLRLEGDVTGTWLQMGWAQTLDLARRLQPETRRAVVVGGASPTDRVWMDEADRQLTRAMGSVEISYLAGPRFDDVLKVVADLPPGTVVLVGTFLRDAAGRDFLNPEAIRRIAAASRVPTYALTDNSVGTGAVGGQVVSYEAHGQAAADLALRVLGGGRPAPTGEGTIVPVVDARQLGRWGLDARRLPTGTVVRFREASLWEQHRQWVVAAGAALLLQSGLIGGLLVQRSQRRRAQRTLAERLRFETLLSDLSASFAASPPGETEEELASGLHRIGTGLGADWATVRTLEGPGREVRLMQAWTRAGIPHRPAVIREDETPWIFSRLRDGHVVRFGQPGDLPAGAAADRRYYERLGTRSAVVVPLVVGGVVAGALSIGTVSEDRGWPDDLVSRLQLLAEVFANALERERNARAVRESEAQIRTLAGRLMMAQEEERRRVARDLHDDVGQRLSLLAIQAEELQGGAPGPDRRVQDLAAKAQGLASDVQRIAYELHPARLEHLGFPAALRGFIDELRNRHGLAAQVVEADWPRQVPPDVALCLYRVTQEALRNVVRHSEVREARVTLEGRADHLTVTISDAGVGFEAGARGAPGGLGLTGMQERLRFVGGTLTVAAAPGRGTSVRARVPRGPSPPLPKIQPGPEHAQAAHPAG
jgi:signal transduction histidine kinase